MLRVIGSEDKNNFNKDSEGSKGFEGKRFIKYKPEIEALFLIITDKDCVDKD